MGSVIQKLKRAWYAFLAWLIFGVIAALAFALIAGLWWLDRVRFTF